MSGPVLRYSVCINVSQSSQGFYGIATIIITQRSHCPGPWGQDLNPGWLASQTALLPTKLHYLLCGLLTSTQLVDNTESPVLLGTGRTKEMEEAGMKGHGRSHWVCRSLGNWRRLLQLRNRASEKDFSLYFSLEVKKRPTFLILLQHGERVTLQSSPLSTVCTHCFLGQARMKRKGTDRKLMVALWWH